MDMIKRRYGLDLSHLDLVPVLPWAGVIAGTLLLAVGFVRRNRWAAGAGAACAGGALVYRGLAGQRGLGGQPPGRRRRGVLLEGRRAVHVEREIAIDRPADVLYRFWRNFENLPRFMRHLEAVERLDQDRSRWVVSGPAGLQVEWVAVVEREVVNELIQWRSLEGSDVDHRGSVTFRALPDGQSTLVKVSLQYVPPGGRAGVAFARLFGRDAAAEIRADLRRFKQLMEAGQDRAAPQEPDRVRQRVSARSA